MSRPRRFTIPLGAAAAVAVVVVRHGRRAGRGHRVSGGVLVGHAGVYNALSQLLLGPFFGRIAADVVAVASDGARRVELVPSTARPGTRG